MEAAFDAKIKLLADHRDGLKAECQELQGQIAAK